MVIYEDEHPLNYRESETGMRNVVIYHTAGPTVNLISSQTDIVGDIWTFETIVQPEDPNTWDGIYNKVLNCISQSGQVQGHYVATATTSDMENKGFQTAVVIRYDLTMA